MTQDITVADYSNVIAASEFCAVGAYWLIAESICWQNPRRFASNSLARMALRRRETDVAGVTTTEGDPIFKLS